MSYPAAVDAAVEMYRIATPEQLRHRVEWTPRWSAGDVLAHLVSGARRNVQSIMGPPADEEAHQAVLELRGATVAALLQELETLAPQVTIPAGAPSTEWDIVCHLADVRETWGLSRLDESLWRPVLADTLAFCDRVGRLPGTVVLDGSTAGTAADGRVVEVKDGYQLFRAIFHRLPLDQLEVEGDVQLLRPAVFFG